MKKDDQIEKEGQRSPRKTKTEMEVLLIINSLLVGISLYFIKDFHGDFKGVAKAVQKLKQKFGELSGKLKTRMDSVEKSVEKMKKDK